MTSTSGQYSIIGMVGRTGAGRESAAGILAHGCNYQRVGFGDALRAEIAKSFRVDSRIFMAQHLRHHAQISLAISRSDDARFIRQMMELDINPSVARTPQQIMHWWAVKYRRYLEGDWYWVHRLHDSLEALFDQGHRRIVIADVQFENEAKFLRSLNGALWRISRRSADTPHPATQGERESQQIECHQTISNEGTLNQLVYDVLNRQQTTSEATDLGITAREAA